MGCERGEGLVCIWFIWEDCKGECCAFTGKASVTATKKNKVPVLLSSPPNKSALVISEDDSDANETFHDAETISDKAHESMPPSQLSPRRARVSGPNSSSNARPPREPVRALFAGGGGRLGRPQRLPSPLYWPPAWVVVIGLQLISARSGQPRR